jgi:ClpA/ClpB-like protein
MFERFTEKARRVVFFARYEAGNYGSRCIETEHLLLGLLREDSYLVKRIAGELNAGPAIRAEIEKRIVRGEPFRNEVEVPLSAQSKTVLNLAKETAEKLGHRWIDTEHLLIGLLGVEVSMAAQILSARGLKPGLIQEDLARASAPPQVQKQAVTNAQLTLESFLSGFKSLKPEELLLFFAMNAKFIDASGTRWDRREIESEFEILFASYAKENASYLVEEMFTETSNLLVANVLWKAAVLPGEEPAWMHRMGIVLLADGNEWAILFAQVTPVRSSAHAGNEQVS